MSCVLRATGSDFNVESFLDESTFAPCNVFLKGELKAKNHAWETNGLTLDVSAASFNNFIGQIHDAIKFLKENKRELVRLRNFNGLEEMSLDFGVERKNGFLQSSFFPPDLIALAGELGMGLELSIYGED